MTVEELIEKLKEFPSNSEIFIIHQGKDYNVEEENIKYIEFTDTTNFYTQS